MVREEHRTKGGGMKGMESDAMRLLQEQRDCLAQLVSAMEARMAAKAAPRRVSICAVQSDPTILDGRIHDLQKKQIQ